MLPFKIFIFETGLLSFAFVRYRQWVGFDAKETKLISVSFCPRMASDNASRTRK